MGQSRGAGPPEPAEGAGPPDRDAGSRLLVRRTHSVATRHHTPLPIARTISVVPVPISRR
jgi:hypothetical protein